MWDFECFNDGEGGIMDCVSINNEFGKFKVQLHSIISIYMKKAEQEWDTDIYWLYDGGNHFQITAGEYESIDETMKEKWRDSYRG